MLSSLKPRFKQISAVCNTWIVGTNSFLCSSLSRKMSDHMEKTSESPRESGISDAEVISITNASETVKVLTLKIDDSSFAFKAGQWVDMFIPRVPTIGGFSMFSAPKPFHEKGEMGLAVKYSSHPPAHWVHKQCAVGSKVKVRAGGDKLIFDPQPGDPAWNVLLISGGIGINPLMSIMHHAADLHTQREGNPEGYTPGKMELLFSASSKSELIFKDTIDELTSKHSANISAKFFVTKETASDPSISNRRMDVSDIKSALEKLGKSPLRCFVCGPPSMIADMEGLLSNEGIPSTDVFCEKWW